MKRQILLSLFVALFAIGFVLGQNPTRAAGASGVAPDGSVAGDPVTCPNPLPSKAQVVPGGNGAPSQNFEAGFDDFDTQLADDFTMGQAAVITSIDFTGTFSLFGPISSITVRIYDDGGGVPGTLIYSSTVGPADAVSPFDPNVPSFTHVIDNGFMINPGTYWVSAVVNMDFGCCGQWFWSTATDNQGEPYQFQNPGGGFGLGCTSWDDGAAVCGVGGGVNSGEGLLFSVNFCPPSIPCVSEFDVTAEFGDNTQVIAAGAFASDDIFSLPAGDCQSDPTFSVFVPDDGCFTVGDVNIAATNLTTGAFLQVSARDAFGDFVFELDDVTKGTYQIEVVVADEQNTATESFSLTVEDVTGPTLDIPGGTLALQAPSVCEGDRLQVWTLQADDDCDGETAVEVVSVNETNFFGGPADFFYNGDFGAQNYGALILDLSANPFQVNTALVNLFYEITVKSTDNSGNETIKTFFVQVDPPAVGGINSLACNDNVNVTLNANCVAPLFPDAVLEGLPSACEGDYYVKVAYPFDGHSINEVTKCGTFKYVVYRKGENGNDVEICWGNVTGEDKTPPTGCIDKVIGLRKTEGSFEEETRHDKVVDIKINADYFGAKEGKKEFKKIGGDYYYYEPLTYNNYCEGDHIDAEFDYTLDSDNLLICTDVDSILNVTASYTDKDYAYFTGTPALFDNCATEGWEPVITKVTDRLIDYQCEYPTDAQEVQVADGRIRIESQRIARTFFFEDEKGNQGEVTQYICFFKPKIKLPNCKETFDVCWYGADNELLPEDIGSYPSFVNAACMEMPLLDHACNVTTTFEDLRLPGPLHCGDKVIRTWTILDWCWDPIRYGNLDLTHVDEGCPNPEFSEWKSKKLTWEQHLIIGGADDFEVFCPEQDEEWYNGSDAPTFSTGAFGCEASFEVPAPIVEKDGKASNVCQYTWTIEIYAYVDELWHGVPTGNKILERYEAAHITEDIDEENWTTNSITVSKLPKGEYYFIYKAKDLCGGEAYSDYCKFYVIDEIAPITICDDDLNISIGGDNYSRVYAADIDEGSFDNCSDIELKARRFIPEDCLDAFVENTEWTYADIYYATRRSRTNNRPIKLDKDQSVYDGSQGYYSPWFDYVDFTCCDIKGEVLIELRATDNANMSRDAKNEPIYGDNVKPFDDFKVKQKDNENICWLEVYVEDKLPPICQAPKDVEIDCEDVPYDLPEVSKHTSEGKNGITWGEEEINDPANALIVEWLNSFDDPAGRPAAIDNCNAEVKMVKVKFVIHCKAGYIERTFQAEDDWGLKSSNTCKQRIWIARHHDYCIKFPKDAEAECKEVPNIPTVEFFEYGCDLLAVSIQDERFNTDIDRGNESECYKIFRTYRVINWCQFDEDIDPDLPLFDRFDTFYDIDPLVVGRDEDCDGWPGDEDVYVRFKGKENKNGVLEGTTWIDSDCDPWNDSPKSGKGCDNPWGHWEEWPGYTGGFYQYTQVIKVYDDVAPELTSVGEDRFPTYANPGKDDDKSVCVGQVDRMLEVTEECTPDAIEIDRVILNPDPALGLGPVVVFERGAVTNMGASFGFAISSDDLKFTLSGQFPIGSHEFEVRVADGCGITAGIDLPFEVFDDKAPAPICNSSLSVELMPVDADNDGRRDAGVGMVEVWAKDFIASDIWDCSEPIKYTIERAADIDNGAEPDPDNTNIVLNCEDAEVGVVLVYVYAWDAVGNRDRCEAMIIVTDAMDVCSDNISPEGVIAGLVYTEEDYAVADVEVQVSGQATDGMMTGNTGDYEFRLEAGLDYTVTPLKDTDHKNGVSTYDIVTISQHILGVKALNSPYKMIAADVNSSKSITTLDLIMLRRLVLSIDREFANNTSWRFVDASYNFPEEVNPWKEAFPEVINVNDLEADALINGDFIAVKIGDVTGDAQVGDLIEGRETVGTFAINVEDQAIVAGNEYAIEFSAADLASVQGYQFTLNYDDAIELVDIQSGVAMAENFGLAYTDEGVITTSWNGTASDEVLFTLVVKANTDAQLSEVLTIGSLYTRAEAYNQGGALLDVAIDFGSNVVAASSLYELGQNQPNPFKGMTTIKYIVPQSGDATLTITDMTGKVLNTWTQDAVKGENVFQLNSSELPTGVLYYTLESADFTATKKMITIE